jgi:BirA family biotin operon repressor/biotin-[acetyl-CoA-carboxylase] ligase
MDHVSLTTSLALIEPTISVNYSEVTESTNGDALASIARGSLPDWSLFIASRQTRGRGNRGKTWESSSPVGLWMSLVVFDSVSARPFSFWPSVSLTQVLREHYRVDAHVKWPNDVLVGSRKLGGILIERVSDPDGREAGVVGIGVNVLQKEFIGELAGLATSLLLETNRIHPIERLLTLLVRELYETRNNRYLTQLWSGCTEMIGRKIMVKSSYGSRIWRAIGVTEEGWLQLEDPDTRERTLLTSVDGVDISARYDPPIGENYIGNVMPADCHAGGCRGNAASTSRPIVS